jgi:hypothetical protein
LLILKALALLDFIGKLALKAAYDFSVLLFFLVYAGFELVS